jgi:hypothetical protein
MNRLHKLKEGWMGGRELLGNVLIVPLQDIVCLLGTVLKKRVLYVYHCRKSNTVKFVNMVLTYPCPIQDGH